MVCHSQGDAASPLAAAASFFPVAPLSFLQCLASSAFSVGSVLFFSKSSAFFSAFCLLCCLPLWFRYCFTPSLYLVYLHFSTFVSLAFFFYSFLPRYSPPSVYFGFLNNVFCIVLRLFPFLTFSTIILHLNLQPFLFFDIYFTFPSFALRCHSQDALQEMCCTMHQLPSCFSLNCSTFLI